MAGDGEEVGRMQSFVSTATSPVSGDYYPLLLVPPRRGRRRFRGERAVIGGFVCILLFIWVVVKVVRTCVFFVRMGLKHGLRGRHIS